MFKERIIKKRKKERETGEERHLRKGGGSREKEEVEGCRKSKRNM